MFYWTFYLQIYDKSNCEKLTVQPKFLEYILYKAGWNHTSKKKKKKRKQLWGHFDRILPLLKFGLFHDIGLNSTVYILWLKQFFGRLYDEYFPTSLEMRSI